VEKMKKVAVILLSLGGPDSREAIKPFLHNFFSDPAIIPLPSPFRNLVAWLIAKKRSAKEAAASYKELGYKSPLLENTQAQARAISDKLKSVTGKYRFGVFTCMRYWPPRAEEVIKEVESFSPDLLILLPMYPQFSTTTTASSFREWREKISGTKLAEIPEQSICCYPENPGFIRASAKLIKSAYEEAVAKGHANPRLLLSAHGLPEYVIKKGDPYQKQCEQTAAAIIKELDINNIDWTPCYQSRVGPAKWIGPDTEGEILKAAKEKKPVIVYTHAFVCDHVETLVEIDIEYRKLAMDNDSPYFARVPTVGTEEEFVEGLADMVLAFVQKYEAEERQ
jgi:ferrochelatase